MENEKDILQQNENDENVSIDGREQLDAEIETKKGILSYYKKPDSKGKKALAITKKLCKRYFIDAFTGMAQGLFCTLIAGTILAMFGDWIGQAGTSAGISVGKFVTAVANIAKSLMGAGIGIGIAHALHSKKLVLFTAAVAGMAGAFADKIIAGTFALSAGVPGNPIGAYVVSVIAVEIGNLICGKTKVDIVIVPLAMMLVSMLSLYVAWPFIQFVNVIGKGVALATMVTPEAMGILVAVVMGILLTLPTSSAAIWVAIATPIITGYGAGTVDFATFDAIMLAGGAATVGCACQMVGFAVESFRENKWGGLVAQGLGTSMLQIPNLMRHPQIIIPPIIASVIAGPLSTCVFTLKCGAAGGGMGTSGLVGVVETVKNSAEIAGWKVGLGIALCMFVIPAVVCVLASEIMRKKGWLKPEYLKLEI
ncbi:MAG: PTS sugar transporter subunit IIC [Bacteroides sp.]|nr:PTS sugar transporter subunit IIC [Bacillota bacterium]MCM1393414.1 PTS sugar transporter subunit IIC [[Eubacterium] siraeum]MCM1455400.1 PTS sugar transporter subunit IIC [Bacteroides sp.]